MNPISEIAIYEAVRMFSASIVFAGRKANLTHLIGKPYFELMRHDVTLPLYKEVDQI